GSTLFCPSVDSGKRKKLVANMIAFIIQERFTGIDIDWEFPGREGYFLTYNKMDTANLILFANAYKAGTKKTISASALTVPFIGEYDTPITDLKPVSDAFDYINDMNGPWNANTGPNAPFKSLIGNPSISFFEGVRTWVSAGLPGRKLVMGIPLYGHGFRSAVKMDGTTQVAPIGDKDYSVDYTYIQILDILNDMTSKTGTGNYKKFYDPFTLTPWIYNQQTSEYITYDDPLSAYRKAYFADCIGLGGVFIWESSQDANQI
ncbi:glycoside hydrolase, partial [Chytriomyces cf. hyalinus JEL632]